MTTGELQQQLFNTIKSKMGEDVSPAEEIAGLLDISTDSAYRRMRGEKTISIEELQTLCVHYRISVDQLMGIHTGEVVFFGQYLDKKTFRFDEYVSSIIQNLAYMNSFKEKTFYYVCKDLPIFHHYHIQNQMKRSTLISEVSEKERARFFRIIRERIQHRMESLHV